MSKLYKEISIDLLITLKYPLYAYQGSSILYIYFFVIISETNKSVNIAIKRRNLLLKHGVLILSE